MKTECPKEQPILIPNVNPGSPYLAPTMGMPPQTINDPLPTSHDWAQDASTLPCKKKKKQPQKNPVGQRGAADCGVL